MFGREAHPDEFAGIGIELEISEGNVYPMVTRSFPEGGAREAGILRGDRITKVDGENVEGVPLMTLVKRLRGKPGSTVALVVEGGDGRTREVLVRRKLFEKGQAGEEYVAR